MKKLTVFAAIVATSLIATKSYSQVYVGAHVGFRVPGVRVYVGARAVPPPVVYQQPVYTQPAPVYDDPGYAEPAPAYDGTYDGGYYADPAVCEADFPGYAYYDYPAWYGHYRDRVYFEHYRPFFERTYGGYFAGGRFDHARFDHDRGGYARGGYAGGGYARGGYARGFEGGRGMSHEGGYARGFSRGGGNEHSGGFSRGGGFGHDHGSHRGR